MTHRLPLVCSVHQPSALRSDTHDAPTTVRLRIKCLLCPLPQEAAIAPSFRVPLAGEASCGDESMRDPLTEIGVTPRCLLRLALLSGGWARLATTSNVTASSPSIQPPRYSPRRGDLREGECEYKADERQAAVGKPRGRQGPDDTARHVEGILCRVLAVTFDPSSGERLADDHVLLPPSLAFNAGLSPFSAYVCLQRETISRSPLGIGRPLVLHRPPPVACSASVSRVKFPRPSGDSAGDAAGRGRAYSSLRCSTAKQARAHALGLMVFFSIPRLLRVGDVFGVSVPTPGGSSGVADGGVGCWWEELEDDEDDEDDQSDDEYNIEGLDREDGQEIKRERVETRFSRRQGMPGSVEEHTAVGSRQHVDQARAGEQCDLVAPAGTFDGAAGARERPQGPRRRYSAAERRFREAIVRQGSELVYFCVSGIAGEDSVRHSRHASNTTASSGADDGSLVHGAIHGPTSYGRRGGRSDASETNEEQHTCGVGDHLGESMVVSRSATALRQGRAMCSSVPEAGWYHQFACQAQGFPCPPAQPPLGERCVGALVAALAPLAGPEAGRLLAVRSRPTILLHGPEASNGGVLVAAAAERLGLHVRTASMRSVLGATAHSGSGSAGEALRQEFAAAREASPCVLHLRGIASLAAGGRAAPGSEEADERFATALSACLQQLDLIDEAAAVAAEAEYVPDKEAAWSQRRSGELRSGRGRGSGSGVVVLIGSAESLERVPTFVRRCFTHEVLAPFPSEKLRLSLLQHHLATARTGECVTADSLQALARRLVGRSSSQIRAVVGKAGGVALARSLGGQGANWLANAEASESSRGSQGLLFEASTRSSAWLSGPGADSRGGGREDIFGGVLEGEDGIPEFALTMEDLEQGERSLPPPNSTMKMGSAKIPQVKWDDVGGLGSVKREILDVVELPLKHPEVFGKGVKRRAGILLYGPPGTGKTLLAKAVATECGLPFFSVKGPELLDMYVGESERNVREVFAQARMAAPCVLFFDELDSLAPARGRGGDSGGVMDRVVAQLLAELDGAASASGGTNAEEGSDNDGYGDVNGEGSGSSTVFVIGATNRPDLLDPSLMRPGRFDRLLYLGVSGDRDTQIKVLRSITRKFEFEEGDIDLDEIVRDRIPPQFTGADLSAVASNALQLALRRRVAEIEAQVTEFNARELYLRPITPQQLLARLPEHEVAVKVSRQDFEVACLSVTPSVSEAELRHYERMREQFSSSGGSGGVGVAMRGGNGTDGAAYS